ncbi:RNA polymerase II C-terminal domain kinase beta subunit [Coemansia interrupta]|uniref:RNA polymerase II C-terminal domain kinase beta subunit n=1 Tax=Coemansia interrupta TaxID=1126814 RepID=A0A9W8HIR2_9FUNG|nr:RNA polymerase II C-terminal domain kinase beta subunit [Coemansia interrupta]
MPPSSTPDRHEIIDHPAMSTATKSCIFIKKLGRSLCFPARTISTAQLLIHRIYIYQPSTTIGSMDLATACLFVAGKMEETIKKLRDMLAHSYVISSQSNGDPQAVSTATTDKMRLGVLDAEQFVMEAIGFDFRTSHPHLLYVKMAKLAGITRATTAAGWHILADSYFTTLPIQYPSAVIAAGSLCLAWNLDCASPHDTSQFVPAAFSITSSSTENRNGHSDRPESSRVNRRSANDTGTASRVTIPEQPRRFPQSLNMSEEWWLQLGISTDDMQSFVRQIADFYLLFFNGTAASPEYIEKHRTGLPSSEMSRKIGQWRMWLQNALTTPVSPKA